MKLQDLVGMTIKKILINESKDFLLLYSVSDCYNQELFYITFTGDCCSQCYIAHVSGYSSVYQISKILEVTESEWQLESRDEEKPETIEKLGIRIKTDKYTLEIETRLEHNGYYGGEVQVSKEYPKDQYGDPWDFKGETFKELEDF